MRNPAAATKIAPCTYRPPRIAAAICRECADILYEVRRSAARAARVWWLCHGGMHNLAAQGHKSVPRGGSRPGSTQCSTVQQGAFDMRCAAPQVTAAGLSCRIERLSTAVDGIRALLLPLITTSQLMVVSGSSSALIPSTAVLRRSIRHDNPTAVTWGAAQRMSKASCCTALHCVDPGRLPPRGALL
jgi:hypothetical protein